MAHPRFSNEEIGQRGARIYEQRLRQQLEAGNHGRYLVIDIETGEYEMGEDARVLSHLLHDKHPNAALYAMRIGHPATVRI